MIAFRLFSASAIVAVLLGAFVAAPPPQRPATAPEGAPAAIPDGPESLPEMPTGPQEEGGLLRSSIPGRVTVVSVVPTDRKVEEGAVLVVLDDSRLREQVEEAKLALAVAEAALKEIGTDREIGDLAMNEYKKGILDRELKEVEGEIALAESRATELRDAVEKAARQKAEPQRQRAIEAEQQKGDFDLLRATMRRDVLTRFTAPRRIKELQAAEQKAASDERLAKLRLYAAQDRLKRLEELLAATRIEAPASGTFYPKVEVGDVVGFRKPLGEFIADEPSAP